MLPSYHGDSLEIYDQNLNSRNITDRRALPIQLENLPPFLELVGKYEYTRDQKRVLDGVIRKYATELAKNGTAESITLNKYSNMLLRK
jgi:hypothetical protein